MLYLYLMTYSLKAYHLIEMSFSFCLTSVWHHEPKTNIPVFLEYVINQFLNFIQLRVFKNESTESWNWQGPVDAICIQNDRSWVIH